MSETTDLNKAVCSWQVILKSVSVWTVIIVAESINGTLRELLLVPRFGNELAKQISFGVALVLILSIAVFFVHWMDTNNTYQLLVVGATWAVLTFCFEVILGRFVLGLAWENITADYDVSRGGMMSFGLVFMLFAPMLASKLRETHPDRAHESSSESIVSKDSAE